MINKNNHKIIVIILFNKTNSKNKRQIKILKIT